MTTSLPTTPSPEILPGAATALAGNATRADGLAALFALVAPTNGAAPDAATANTSTPEFNALLDGSAAPTPGVVSSNLANAVSVAPTAPTNVAASPFALNAPRVVGAEPLAAETATTSTTDARGFALRPCAGDTQVAISAASAPAATDKTTPKSAATPSLPDRSTLEAVVALLMPVAVAVAPESPVLAAGTQTETPAADSGTSTAIEGDVLAARPQVAVALPGRAPIALDETLSPVGPHEGGEENFPAPNASVATAKDTPAASVGSTAVPTAASAGAPTTSVELPTAMDAQPVVAAALPAAPADAASSDSSDEPVALEVSASAELPDGAVVTLALPKTPALAAARSNASPVEVAPVATRREKSAAVATGKNPTNSSAETVAGKNFLTTEDEQVKPARAEAGIGVAQTRPTMLFTPHDTLTAAHPTVPALVSMASAAPAAGAPTPEPMPTLVAASLAHRAVETVTSVVDAQAASKLQPVPSVQLKFKFGAEDLAVRVALRDGVVTTEFRTDSPELRAAIQQEWKSVAAQPESALRFLEPVVSPASSSQSGTNSFAQQQHQQSPGQSAAQQQQQQQQQQSRAAADVFGSVARSTPFQPRDGGAASNIAPIALPTSVHLSAVA